MNHSIILRSILLLAVCLLTLACEDHLDPGISTIAPSREIRFGVSVADVTYSDTPRASRVTGILPLSEQSAGDRLYLHVEVSDRTADDEAESAVASRGTVSGTAENPGVIYDDIAVSAYSYSSTLDSDRLASGPNYFYNELASKGSDGSFAFASPRYWPTDGKMRFLAYAPVDDPNIGFTNTGGAGNILAVTVDEDVTKHKDLLVAFSEEIKCNGTGVQDAVRIHFKHPMTCVRFTCDASVAKAVIDEISIENVQNVGNFYYRLDDASQSTLDSDFQIVPYVSQADTPDWNLNKWGNGSAALTKQIQVAGNQDQDIAVGDDSFIMIPQQLTAVAQVRIVMRKYDESTGTYGDSETLVASLEGREWPAGKIVTYKLSSKDQILQVDEPNVFNYLGTVYDQNTNTFMTSSTVSVSSLKGDKSEPWTMEILGDGATWLTASEDHTANAVTFSASEIPHTSLNINQALSSATARGASYPFNLADPDGDKDNVSVTGYLHMQETANCYIVDSRGSYIFPLVYGCAIQGGKDTPGAYQCSLSGSDILSPLTDHLDKGITSPYIVDNQGGAVPDAAVLLWQDEKDLVTDVRYDASAYGGKGGIVFKAGADGNIRQGNAVIAVKSGDTVMWSWHIWVTDHDVCDNIIEVTNFIDASGAGGSVYDVMPINLGWCSGADNDIWIFPARSCQVKFTSGNLSRTVTVQQEKHIALPRGNCPYYQWGRKDPFFASLDGGNVKTWYDASGTPSTSMGGTINPSAYAGRSRSVEVNVTTHTLSTTREELGLLIQYPMKWMNPSYTQTDSIVKDDATGAVIETKKPVYTSLNRTYTNLWGGEIWSAPQEGKTVYDPCPPGYRVSHARTFTGVTENGGNDTASGVFFVKGFTQGYNPAGNAEFYTDRRKCLSITFPVVGYRDWNTAGEIFQYGERGYVWTDGKNGREDTDAAAHMFDFSATPYSGSGISGSAFPYDNYFVTDGFPVRPCRMAR